jgi:hypothetical protein
MVGLEDFFLETSALRRPHMKITAVCVFGALALSSVGCRDDETQKCLPSPCPSATAFDFTVCRCVLLDSATTRPTPELPDASADAQ